MRSRSQGAGRAVACRLYPNRDGLGPPDGAQQLEQAVIQAVQDPTSTLMGYASTKTRGRRPPHPPQQFPSHQALMPASLYHQASSCPQPPPHPDEGR